MTVGWKLASSSSIVDTLLHWQKSLPIQAKTIVVGLSGGQDSQVLLHALSTCSQIRETFSLRVIHIHHGLSSKADEWAKHCEITAAVFDLPLQIFHLELIPPKGESVEDYARKARYDAFKTAMEPHELLVTAHHLEDQAETLLLQLLRGAGLKGLSGMPALKAFHSGWHARPFLKVSKSAIQQYAEEAQLNWVEDDSNENVRFTRNAIRHQVIPVLKQLNPNYAECLSRSAEHCQTAQALLEEDLEQDLAVCLHPDGLLVNKLKDYSPLRQEALMRLWLHNQGYALPSLKKLRTMVHQMVHAKIDRHPCVEWGNWQVRRKKGVVVVEPNVILYPLD